MSIHEFGAASPRLVQEDRMVDRTRVHLDDVEGLGTFLMAALGIQEDQLVSRAYIDLLQSR